MYNVKFLILKGMSAKNVENSGRNMLGNDLIALGLRLNFIV